MNRWRQGIIEASLSRSFFHSRRAILADTGDVVHRGQVRPAADALRDAGLAPIELAEKEGLAVTNGTDAILGTLCLAIADIERIVDQADMITAMTVEGPARQRWSVRWSWRGAASPAGPGRSAANLRRMLADSPIVASHANADDARVQDVYSIRCTPSVHGAVRGTLAHCRTVAEHELASAIDNPMVFPDGRAQFVRKFPWGSLGVRRRLSRHRRFGSRRHLRASHRPHARQDPQPRAPSPFLAEEVGVDSGLMIGHYTAAAMASENKRLAAPASVDSLPTSGMQEDHVSMAWLAVRKLRRVVDNVRRILAVEYTCAARAIELRGPLEPARPTAALCASLRRDVAGVGPDRFLAPELAAAERLLDSDELNSVLHAVGVTLAANC